MYYKIERLLKKMSTQVSLFTEAYRITHDGRFLAFAYDCAKDLEPAEARRNLDQIEAFLEAEEAEDNETEVG